MFLAILGLVTQKLVSSVIMTISYMSIHSVTSLCEWSQPGKLSFKWTNKLLLLFETHKISEGPLHRISSKGMLWNQAVEVACPWMLWALIPSVAGTWGLMWDTIQHDSVSLEARVKERRGRRNSQSNVQTALVLSMYHSDRAAQSVLRHGGGADELQQPDLPDVKDSDCWPGCC